LVGHISTALAAANPHIADLLNTARGALASTLIAIDGSGPEAVLGKMRQIDGVLAVRPIAASRRPGDIPRFARRRRRAGPAQQRGMSPFPKTLRRSIRSATASTTSIVASTTS
jgi:hypothetical protein